MENSQFKEEFDKCFNTLNNLICCSFEQIAKNPDRKEETLNLWTSNIKKFMSFTYKASEKYNNRDIFKAITKVLIFGK